MNFVFVFVGNLDLLFLDELIVGMDIMFWRMFWEMIWKLVSEGKIIILMTYYLEEVDVLVNCILLFVNGKIIVDGILDEMKVTILWKIIIFYLKESIFIKLLKELLNVIEVKLSEGCFILIMEDMDVILKVIY